MWLMRFSCSACSAETDLPASNRSSARFGPASCDRKKVPPPSGEGPEHSVGRHELRVLCGKADVAADRQRKPGASRSTLDRSDDGHRQLVQRQDEGMKIIDELIQPRDHLSARPGKTLHVAAGHEGRSRAAQDEHTQIGAFGQFSGKRTQASRHVQVHGVQRMRPVEGDRADPAFDLEKNWLAHQFVALRPFPHMKSP